MSGAYGRVMRGIASLLPNQPLTKTEVAPARSRSDHGLSAQSILIALEQEEDIIHEHSKPTPQTGTPTGSQKIWLSELGPDYPNCG